MILKIYFFSSLIMMIEFGYWRVWRSTCLIAYLYPLFIWLLRWWFVLVDKTLWQLCSFQQPKGCVQPYVKEHGRHCVNLTNPWGNKLSFSNETKKDSKLWLKRKLMWLWISKKLQDETIKEKTKCFKNEQELNDAKTMLKMYLFHKIQPLLLKM